jgi:putative restriction endonuclease
VTFKALEQGEPFLFKLHSPEDFIVGGGFFTHFSLLPHRLAWDFFEEKNGAATLAEMERRIVRYRRGQVDRGDFTIGCILLAEPSFFSREDWIPAPADWSKNIVRGKGYDLTEGLGARLWEDVTLRFHGQVVAERAEDRQRSLYGEPILVRPRLGQGTFRAVITDTYERRCAVTHEKALPVLDAAHIRPVKSGGRHLIENGMLLRSDVHRLFDAGYVTVTPDHRFRVSRLLKEEFDNGEPYYPFDGDEVWLPPRPEAQPRKEFLEWHADTVFRG